jgi:hypothetical protein
MAKKAQRAAAAAGGAPLQAQPEPVAAPPPPPPPPAEPQQAAEAAAATPEAPAAAASAAQRSNAEEEPAAAAVAVTPQPQWPLAPPRPCRPPMGAPARSYASAAMPLSSAAAEARAHAMSLLPPWLGGRAPLAEQPQAPAAWPPLPPAQAARGGAGAAAPPPPPPLSLAPLSLAPPAAPEDAAEDARTCVVCLDAQRAVVLLPCRHNVACAACAESLPRPRLCPVCREPVAELLCYFT